VPPGDELKDLALAVGKGGKAWGGAPPYGEAAK